MIVLSAVRTALFYLLFIGQTIVCAVIVGTPMKLTGRRTGFGLAVATYWASSNLWLLRWITGIKTEVDGAENIPDGPCILAAKHMSDWDIFAIFPHSKRPAFIAKKELMDIPFFGWAAQSLDCIRIDRSKGSEAIPLMLKEARDALDRGCRIIIFPEGTRKAPLAEPDYKIGIMRMYEALKVPVVPIALNSGLYWGRNSLLLWPGTAKARFLPPIAPGLSGSEFMAKLKGAIEPASAALIAEAHRNGLNRPLPAALKAKLDALS